MSQFGQWRRSKCEHALQSQPSPDTSPSRLRGRQTQITRVNSPAMSRLESEPKLKANPNSIRCRKEWVRKWRNFPLKNLWIITALRNTAVICFPFMDELEDFWVDEDVTDNENVGGHGVVPPVTPQPQNVDEGWEEISTWSDSPSQIQLWNQQRQTQQSPWLASRWGVRN